MWRGNILTQYIGDVKGFALKRTKSRICPKSPLFASKVGGNKDNASNDDGGNQDDEPPSQRGRVSLKILIKILLTIAILFEAYLIVGLSLDYPKIGLGFSIIGLIVFPILLCRLSRKDKAKSSNSVKCCKETNYHNKHYGYKNYLARCIHVQDLKNRIGKIGSVFRRWASLKYKVVGSSKEDKQTQEYCKPNKKLPKPHTMPSRREA
jgi:hypothetical protein